MKGLVLPSKNSQHGTAEWVEPADLHKWGLQTDSKQMRSCSQQFLIWNPTAGVSNKMRDCGPDY